MNAATAKKKSNAKEKSAPAGGESTQAQFFTAPYPLDAKRHGDAGLRKNVGFEFARKANSVVITLQEMPEVARSYPIVFTDDVLPRPVAMLSLEDENHYIDSEGKWDEQHYIPAYIRKYPFGLSSVNESNQHVLCVDEDAPHFMLSGADMPFYEGDKPAAICENALKFCGAFQQQYDASEAFCKAIKEADLLEEKRVQYTLPNGEVKSIGGFTILSEEQWNAFAKKNIASWQEKGFVVPVMLALASQINWRYLSQRQRSA